MTSHEILKADVMDIVFQNRNKQYGAYALRKNYPARLGWALAISCSSFLLLYFLINGTGNNGTLTQREQDFVEVTTVVITPIELPPPVAALPPPAATQPPTATTSFTSVLRMVDEVDPELALRDMDEMNVLAVGGRNRDGAPDTAARTVPQPPPITGGGTATPPASQNVTIVEQFPEFPGGQAAWLRFLERNLQTPEDLLPGDKKTVQVSFMVDTEGLVTGFRVIQSGGREFDQEVIRVLKKMPKWRPAIQNGHPIAISFTQPVTFVGSEQ